MGSDSPRTNQILTAYLQQIIAPDFPRTELHGYPFEIRIDG